MIGRDGVLGWPQVLAPPSAPGSATSLPDDSRRSPSRSVEDYEEDFGSEAGQAVPSSGDNPTHSHDDDVEEAAEEYAEDFGSIPFRAVLRGADDGSGWWA